MNRQAQVGAFAIVSLVLLFAVFYYITDFSTRHTGYQIGVHFRQAAGITPGALVYFSGVDAGTVSSIALLPDNTVEVVLAIRNTINVPVASKFLIQAPVTGTPNVLIVPPLANAPIENLPRRVLPVAQQPQGTSSATIADLLAQGQGEMKRLDTVMGELEAQTPKLLNKLQTTLDNANALTLSARDSMQMLSQKMMGLGSSLQDTLATASSNIDRLTGTLNSTMSRNSGRIDTLMTQLDDSSVALNKAMGALQDLATDSRLKANVLATTKSIAQATQNMAALLSDMRTVTGDPRTQAQVRDTVTNLDALTQRASSLLGELGGTSHVYGVDANATPPSLLPGATPYPYVPPSPGASAAPQGVSPQVRKHLSSSLANLERNLVALQFRFSGLSPEHATGPNPVLTQDRGPQGDLNAVVLPNAPTSVMFGANDIGYQTTWNAAVLQSEGENVHVGAGVLYSQIGVLGRYDSRSDILGFETRLYDPRYPMLDLYGNVKLLPSVELFFGQRDTLHATRRNVYGLQYTL